MGLNISNRQIAKELGLNESDVRQMTIQLREGVTQAKPTPKLKNEVESDEVYKGNLREMKMVMDSVKSMLTP